MRRALLVVMDSSHPDPGKRLIALPSQEADPRFYEVLCLCSQAFTYRAELIACQSLPEGRSPA